MKNDYTQGLEKQLEELQEKLALAQWEAEQYKETLQNRKGKLALIVHSSPPIGGGSAEHKSAYMAEIIIRPEKDSSGHWMYRFIKDRTGKRQDKTFTIEQIREFAMNFWE